MIKEFITSNGRFAFVKPDEILYKQLIISFNSYEESIKEYHNLSVYSREKRTTEAKQKSKSVDMYGNLFNKTLKKLKIKNSSFIGFVENLTEEQWSNVVDWNNESQYYYNYPNKTWEGDITATESAKSLMNSLGINENENWLLVKFKEQ